MPTNTLWQKADPCLPGDGGEEWEGGVTKKPRETSGVGVMNMFIILITVLISWLYTHVKTYQAVHSKSVQFAVCQLYLNKDVK